MPEVTFNAPSAHVPQKVGIRELKPCSVTYLLEADGVPLVPARASFSHCVGSRVSVSDTARGVVLMRVCVPL